MNKKHKTKTQGWVSGADFWLKISNLNESQIAVLKKLLEEKGVENAVKKLL